MLTVSGYSDDIIELTGDINDEFGCYEDAKNGVYLAFSDGTALKVIYDEDGLWRLKIIMQGALYETKIEGSVEFDINDSVIFKDGIKWCVMGKEIARP